MTLRVSSHAISRYRRRVEPVDYNTALAALSTPAIQSAARIGATSVILPNGCKAIIRNQCVVTVKPKHCRKKRVS